MISLLEVVVVVVVAVAVVVVVVVVAVAVVVVVAACLYRSVRFDDMQCKLFQIELKYRTVLYIIVYSDVIHLFVFIYSY